MNARVVSALIHCMQKLVGRNTIPNLIPGPKFARRCDSPEKVAKVSILKV